MIIFFPHRDSKTESWGASLRNRHGIKTIALGWHPFFHWFEVLICSLKYRSRPVYFFRYLGDYPDLLRTLLRLIADILTVGTCLLLGGQVRWIVHNVDRETFMHYPKLLGVRRHIIGKLSKRVYVTDDYLLPIATEILGIPEGKLAVATFGCAKNQGSYDFTNSIIERIIDVKKSVALSPLFGLCATALASKCEHIFRMENVLNELNSEGLSVIIILVCDLDKAPNSTTQDAVRNLSRRTDVIAFIEGGNVIESALKNNVDFIYRSLSDQSLPYTVYNAAQAETPILTHNVGLTADLVRFTGIGVVWEDLKGKRSEELQRIFDGISSSKYKSFLSTRSWERGADALAEGLYKNVMTISPIVSSDLMHICNNYTSSVVHKSIAGALAKTFDHQVFIIPVRTCKELSVSEESTKAVTLVPVLFTNSVVRFFPLLKSLYVFALCFRFLRKNCPARVTKTVLAHNFWSDGMIAFFFSFFREINYTLVVRNTDINIFIPKLPQYRWVMKWMISRSNGLVFVSDAHQKMFVERYPGLASAAKKIGVVPNGIDDYWLNSIFSALQRPKRICYVGRFNVNKNLSRLIEACERLGNRIPDLELVLAGGDKEELEKLIGKDIPSRVRVLGFVDHKDTLRDIYRSSKVFAMPSITETFGLVYLEALSQGCSILCTVNQGIDGMFDKPYVRAINPLSVQEIEEALSVLILSEHEVSPHEISECLGAFSWREVGLAYAEALA